MVWCYIFACRGTKAIDHWVCAWITCAMQKLDTEHSPGMCRWPGIADTQRELAWACRCWPMPS